MPHRWVVERTRAWLTTNRRLNKGDEDLPVIPEALIDIAMSRWMLKRLTQ